MLDFFFCFPCSIFIFAFAPPPPECEKKSNVRNRAVPRDSLQGGVWLNLPESIKSSKFTWKFFFDICQTPPPPPPIIELATALYADTQIPVFIKSWMSVSVTQVGICKKFSGNQQFSPFIQKNFLKFLRINLILFQIHTYFCKLTFSGPRNYLNLCSFT